MTKRVRTAGIAASAVAAAGAVVAVVLVIPHHPAQKLQQAQRSGSRASANQEQIVQRLQQIAGHLEQGTTISHGTARIRRLTAAQRRSLQSLVGLLRQELAALRQSAGGVARTRSSAARLARLSTQQVRQLRLAIRSLQRIRAVAADSSATSAEVARLAVYGARLAEDTSRSFSG